MENTFVDRIWGIRAQLKFYNQLGEFIGFEEDDHETYIESSRKIALSIYTKPTEEYDHVRLTIDATAEKKEDKEGIKDYLIALGFLVLMVGGVTAYQLFNQ